MFNFRKRTNKLDSNQYQKNCFLFIPVVAHYNDHTLLSKDGHLIQTIRVRSVDAQEITQPFAKTRQVVRDALHQAIGDSKDFAVWIHTIKTTADLSDHAQHSCFFTNELNNEWNKKNHWCDKYINNLYISIVHQAATIDCSNVYNFLKTLRGTPIIELHQKYCQEALATLDNISNIVLQNLTEYGAYRLGVIESAGAMHSQLAAFYQQLLWFEEGFFYLQDSQLSDLLTHDKKYAIGNDKIEIISGEQSKFAAILSIKEYQEVQVERLDYLLQIPVQMIITEVFYPIHNSEVTQKFSDRHEILEAHADPKLMQASEFIIATQKTEERFCMQRLSVTVVHNTITELDVNIQKVSKNLSFLGLMHVREDIDLESTFWSNLPGNFAFIKRLSHNLLRYTAAFASVHNFPLGDKYNSWGNAVTLFRTEMGTPYFFNLHGSNGNNITAIVGHERSGKTVLTNFIFAQAQKYQAHTLYLSQTTHARIFHYMLGATCHTDNLKGLINPLLLEDREITREFFKIILNHYVSPLSTKALELLEVLLDWIESLEVQQKNLTFILKNFDFTGNGVIAQEWHTILKPFTDNEYCSGMFDCEEHNDASGLYLAFDNISAEWFTEKFKPREQKYLMQFYQDLDYHHSVRFALFYSFIVVHCARHGADKKMLIVDDLDRLINTQYFMRQAWQIFDTYQQNNGVVLFNTQVHAIPIEYKKDIDNIAQVLLLAGNYGIEVQDIYHLHAIDREKLSQSNRVMHSFILLRDKISIPMELSISNLTAILKILSCGKKDEELFNKILQNDQSQNLEQLQQKIYSMMQAKFV